MLISPSIKSDLAVVREALAHITREYRPSDAALDRLAQALEAMEAPLKVGHGLDGSADMVRRYLQADMDVGSEEAWDHFCDLMANFKTEIDSLRAQLTAEQEERQAKEREWSSICLGWNEALEKAERDLTASEAARTAAEGALKDLVEADALEQQVDPPDSINIDWNKLWESARAALKGGSHEV